MSFFKNKTRALMIISTVVLVICMAASTLPTGVVDTTGNIFGMIISPVQKLLGGIVDVATDGFEYIFNISNLDDENEQLKDQISVLNSEVRELSELKNENDRLRALLELKQSNRTTKMIASNVIAGNIDNWYSTFTIDCGTGDGVEVNDAVITDEGLVGYIYEAGYNWAKVKTIADPTSSVAGMIERVDASGLCDGDVSLNSSQKLKMSYLPLSSAIIEGDVVITSGHGGIYPRGLHIGKVTEVSKSSDGLTQVATVEPGVDFGDLDVVMVVK